MLLRIFAAATALLSSIVSVAAANGPSSLYSLLNGMTFNPPGYTIVMYQSCVQNQNAGNPCGTFTNYQSSNGQYTYQLYGPATCSGSCCREFRLALACGSTIQMSGVNENPTCVYSATLSLPQVCGVDLTVGNEIASVSPTTAPPTTTSTPTATITGTTTSTPTFTSSTTMTATTTPTGSNTSSASATSTPLYQILYTPFPSTTSTQTITATTTPLFMITAWPTTSPVNVSATSTPLYYMTAYPSYNPNNATSGSADVQSSAPSSTATILGGVAVGLVGLGAVGFAINHFRKGGSVSGLIGLANENKAKAMNLVNQLPISQEMKDKLKNPESLLPPDAQHAIEVAKQAAANPQSLVNLLPVSDSIKEKLNTIVPTSGEELLAKLQDPEALKAHIQAQVQGQLQSHVQAALGQINLQIPDVQQIVQAAIPSVIVPTVVVTAEAVPSTVETTAATTAVATVDVAKESVEEKTKEQQ
jgi:hypothetical protein